MVNLLLNKINNLREKIKGKKSGQKDHEMLEKIHRAQKEWMDKENYFNFATDPDLVDFAIYDIEASRRKYAYLLKMAKEEKINK